MWRGKRYVFDVSGWRCQLYMSERRVTHNEGTMKPRTIKSSSGDTENENVYGSSLNLMGFIKKQKNQIIKLVLRSQARFRFFP